MASNPITCLLKKLDSGLVDKASVKRIKELTDRFTEQLQGELGEADAPIVAAKEALTAFEYDMNSQIKLSQKVFRSFERADLALEGKNISEAKQVVKQLTLDAHQFDIEGAHRMYSGFIIEAMEDVGEKFYKNLSVSDNISYVKAMMGGPLPKNKDLQALIKASRKSFDFQDADLHRLGATGHKIAPKNTMDMTFYMGHLQKISKEEFLTDIMDNINTKHMMLNSPAISKMKGGLKEYIELAYKVLKDGGNVHATEIKKIGMTPAEFKFSFLRNTRIGNPDKWVKMQAKYGDGAAGEVDVLSHILNRSENAARQSAKLDYFGANPEALVDHIEANLKAKGFRDDKIASIIADAKDNASYVSGGYENHLNPFFKTNTLNPITNKPFQPVQALSTFKSTGAFLLGNTATISAVMTDPAYIRGFQRSMGFTPRGRISTLNLTDASFVSMLKNEHKIAARLKLTIDGTLDKMHARVRGMDSTFGSKAVNKGATKFLRLSGMTPATAMNRTTNVMNSAFNLAERKGVKFNDLKTELKESLNLFNINEADWDVLRTKGIRKLEGVEHMSPNNILEENPEVGKKLGAWFAWAQENGTPTSSIRQQKFIAKMRSAGVVPAAITEMVVTFMGFSGSVWQNHMSKALTGTNGFKYYSELFAYTTLAGALTTTVASILKNQTPESPTELKFWTEAANVGGSLAYFSDLALNGGRSLDQTLGSKITSFTGGTIIDVGEALKKAGGSALEGKETKLAADLFKTAYKFIPGQSLWYAKHFLDESFKKPVLRMLDPKGQKRRDKRDKKKQLVK